MLLTGASSAREPCKAVLAGGRMAGRRSMRAGGRFVVHDPNPTGRAILTLAGLLPPENYTLRVKLAGEKPKKVGLDEKVDLRHAGVEKFKALPRDPAAVSRHGGRQSPWVSLTAATGLRISAIQRALWPASMSSERNNKILSNSAQLPQLLDKLLAAGCRAARPDRGTGAFHSADLDSAVGRHPNPWNLPITAGNWPHVSR
jgi:hypothetical protein